MNSRSSINAKYYTINNILCQMFFRWYFALAAHTVQQGGMSMLMSYIWTGMLVFSLIAAMLTGNGGALAGAVSQGAQAGITLIVSLAGSICLWTGVGRLMEKAGITRWLSRLLRPVLGRLFPSTREDPQLAGHLSANVCANFLGLGNAATPMGIQAAQRLASRSRDASASDELCRLIVLNTASIQLIPANVAAVRSALGCASPFDILPAVWVTSLCSAGLGVAAAWLMGKLWKQ